MSYPSFFLIKVSKNNVNFLLLQKVISSAIKKLNKILVGVGEKILIDI